MIWHLHNSFQAWVTAKNVFTVEECDKIIQLKNSLQSLKGTVGSNAVAENIRNSNITWLTPSAETNWIYEILAPVVLQINLQHFHFDLSYMQDLQLTEYDSSYEGHYTQHVDTFYSDGMNEMQHRHLSLSMQLNAPDQYEGGDLLLYPFNCNTPVLADKTQGTITLFRSHIVHEVKPVTKNTRYSLVAWVCGR